MTDRDQTATERRRTDNGHSEADDETNTPFPETDESDEQAGLGQIIPRPATSLDSPPKGDIGTFTVTLLGDISSAPALEEVERTNKSGTSDARTPLMTVILAILAKHGGTMRLEDLTSQVGRYWNRSFPTSPFDQVEFVYVLVRSADTIRVTE